MVATTGLAIAAHMPVDAASSLGSGVADLTGRFVPSARSHEIVVADEANRANRARTFEEFGGGVAIVWRSASILMTFRPRFTGYLHGLIMLMREQRRFEDEASALFATLSNVFLYASTDTQDLAVELYETLGEQLISIGKCEQGSPAARKAIDEGSTEIGKRMVAWRAAAQADIATA